MRWKWMRMSLDLEDIGGVINVYKLTIETKYGKESFPWWEHGSKPLRNKDDCMLPLYTILEEAYYYYMQEDYIVQDESLLKALRENYNKLLSIGFSPDFIVRVLQHLDRKDHL